jgi:hypothetical protein
MNKAVLFSAATDRWETPQEVKAALYREFALNFDPCPLDGTINGLAPLFCQWYGKRVWCNPPYGRTVGQWIQRGFEAEIAVYLLAARTDTQWFHDLCMPYAQEIRLLQGRLKFSGYPNGAPFPSIVVIFSEQHSQGRLLPYAALANGTSRKKKRSVMNNGGSTSKKSRQHDALPQLPF